MVLFIKAKLCQASLVFRPASSLPSAPDAAAVCSSDKPAWFPFWLHVTESKLEKYPNLGRLAHMHCFPYPSTLSGPLHDDRGSSRFSLTLRSAFILYYPVPPPLSLSR